MPKKAAPAKPPMSPPRTSAVLYARVPDDVHAQLLSIVRERGYPWTLAAVAAEAITRGLMDMEER